MTMTRGNSQARPMPPAVRPTPPTERPLSQAVQAHIDHMKQLEDENVQLRETNTNLINEVKLQRELTQQKEFLLQDERHRFLECDRVKDKYLRFAQEIYTRGDDLGTRLVDMRNGVSGQTITGVQLMKALDEMRMQLDKIIGRAMELAQQQEPQAPPVAQIEDEVKKALDQMGANRPEPTD